MKLRTVDAARVSSVTTSLAILVAISAHVTGLGSAASVVVGAGFMLLNFHLLRTLVSRLIRPGLGKGVAASLLTLKLGLFVVLIAGVFYQAPLAPMSFALGATLLLTAIVLDATMLGDTVGTSGASD